VCFVLNLVCVAFLIRAPRLNLCLWPHVVVRVSSTSAHTVSCLLDQTLSYFSFLRSPASRACARTCCIRWAVLFVVQAESSFDPRLLCLCARQVRRVLYTLFMLIVLSGSIVGECFNTHALSLQSFCSLFQGVEIVEDGLLWPSPRSFMWTLCTNKRVFSRVRVGSEYVLMSRRWLYVYMCCLVYCAVLA